MLAEVMNKKRISLKTREARITRNRRYRYYSTTPLVKLIKPEHHHQFRRWYEKELKTFLTDTDGIDYSSLSKLNFNLKAYGKSNGYSAFARSMARFLTDIGRKKGLTDSIMMIFRYMTDAEHSNLPISESELKSLVYKEF